MSSVMNYAVRPILEVAVPSCQRGFIPGRNFGVNVLELDVHARCQSVAPSGSLDYPVLFSLDFGQAFPSLNQDFLMFVLSCLGLPDILLTFIARLYEAIEGVASLKGEFV
eukprot:5007792-Pyramimonas_sp.AAC.1